VASQIDAVARDGDLRTGLWHGHGVGVDHDLPVVTAGDETPLEPGMVLAVHPNYATADERYGASTVSTYVVTDEGPERLSGIPMEILPAQEGLDQ
jgi:Xaa-Pro aminopeptidase